MANKKEIDDWVDVPSPSDNGIDDWQDVEPSNISPSREEEFWNEVDTSYEQRKPSGYRSLGVGGIQGASRDWGDEAIAKVNTFLGDRPYKENLDRVRYEFQQAKLHNPKLYGTGDFIGAVGTAPAVATPAGAAAYGLAEGITRTLGSASEINQNSLFEAGSRGVTDAALAAAFNKYGPALFSAVGKVTAPIAKTFSDIAGRSAVSAMKPTQEMVKDLQNKNLVEKVGNFALDNKIVTGLNSQNSMDKRAWDTLSKLSDEMKPIYEKSSKATVSNETLKSQIQARAREIQKNPADVKMGQKVGKFADDLDVSASINAVGPRGPENVVYNPSQLKAIRQALQKKINFKKPNNRGANDELRKIVRENEMGLIESVDPALRAKNEDLFRQIRLGNEVEKITERGAAQSAANNWAGLRGSMLGSMVGTGTTMVTGDPVTGVAAGLIAGSIAEVGRRYGNQFLAVNARRISNAANAKTYLPLFEEAAKRGGAAVASLHAQLMDRDPAYAEVFGGKKLSESTPETKAQAAGLAVTNNLLFGADDEVSGFAGALGAGLRGEDMGEAYTSNRDRYRLAKGEAAQRDPAIYRGTDLLMSMATPALGMAGAGASAAQRAMRGAGAGAVLGGLTGAGNAEELSDVPRETFQSALMGGAMGAGASALAGSQGSKVVESGIGRNPVRPINLPDHEPSLKRMVDFNGKPMEHRVYQYPGSKNVYHYLVDPETKTPLATIEGKLKETPNGPGIQIGWSQASGGKGYGKNLYDLVLDTHQNLMSDVQLSRLGSQKVYAEHFPWINGVDTKLSQWGTAEPHQVRIEDPVKFHNRRKFPPFNPEYSAARARMEEIATRKPAEGFNPQLVPPAPTQQPQMQGPPASKYDLSLRFLQPDDWGSEVRASANRVSDQQWQAFLSSRSSRDVLQTVQDQLNAGVDPRSTVENLMDIGYSKELAEYIVKYVK